MAKKKAKPVPIEKKPPKEIQPAPENKVYKLPAEVAAALITGRTALLIPLRNRIKSGESPPTPEEWLTVIELCVDMLADRRKERAAERDRRADLLDKLRKALLRPLANAVKVAEGVIEETEQEEMKF